jgi:uncharacterized protein
LTAYLLDVNVLIAIQWEQDESHKAVFDWFTKTGINSFATCALTQTSWMRMMMNPSFPGRKASMVEAWDALRNLTRLKGHTLWSTSPAYADATAPFARKIFGHLQITDAYLLGLAIHEKGALVTRDRGILHLAGNDYARHVAII